MKIFTPLKLQNILRWNQQFSKWFNRALFNRVYLVVFIVHWHSPSSLRQDGRSASGGVRSRRSFDHFEPVLSFEDESRSVTPPVIASKEDDVTDVRHCRMDNCFDIDKCKRYGFSVYVYPHQDEFGPISKNYQKILDSIRRSPHFTNDPDKACIKGMHFWLKKNSVKKLYALAIFWIWLFSVLNFLNASFA